MVAVAKVQTETGLKVRSKPVGGSGTSITGGLLRDLDPNTELRGSNWYGSPTQVGIAAKMMRDAYVRSSISGVVNPLISSVWDFEPFSKDPFDREVAQCARWAFIERGSWANTLTKVLRYLVNGFSFVEMTDDVVTLPKDRFPNHPGNGFAICPTGFHERPAWTVKKFWQKKEHPDQLEAIEQWVVGSDGEVSGWRKIPADRLIRATWDQEGANFTGLAPLRSAYGPWKIKIPLLVMDAIRHERYGVGTPIGKIPNDATPEEVDEFETWLAELRAHEKGYMILRGEFAVEITKAGESTQMELAIERCNRDIMFNQQQGFMMLGLSSASGRAGGSHALAQTQSGQFEILLDVHGHFLGDVFNYGMDGWSPVRRWVDLNYGPDVGAPKLIARNLPTRDWTKILPVVHNLGISKFLTPDETLEGYLREGLVLPPFDPDTARETQTATPISENGNDSAPEPKKSEPEKSEPEEETEESEEEKTDE